MQFWFSLVSLLLVIASGQRTVVHLVPHSHTDIGWLNTVEGYFYKSPYIGASFYQASVVSYEAPAHEILTEVIHGLEDEPDRRFVWQEMEYFTMWWRMQNDRMKARVRVLVKERRLEFVGGGISSHDEACNTYRDMLANLMSGHQFILKEFGEDALPKVGWQID